MDRRAASRYGKLGQEPEPDPRPARRPHDPPWTCLWCGQWRCQRPLQLCGACEAEYQKLAAGMPEDKPEVYPMWQAPRET